MVTKKLPEECTSIEDVRNEIDAIDQEILKLLGSRFNYVKEVVKYKNHDKDSIIAKERYNAVLAKRREWAVLNGLSPDVIEKMYADLIAYFISEEMKIVNCK